MAIKLPERNYLTFSEVMKRWDCSENDLIFAIINGDIKPSIRLGVESRVVTWVMNAMGDWHADDSVPEGGYRLTHKPNAWIYLQDPEQTHPFDCVFKYVADSRNPTKDEDSPDYWFKLPTPMVMADIKSSAVFLLKEVAEYEQKHGADAESYKEDKPLRTRERNTLLAIIAALCNETKCDYKKPAHAARKILRMTDRGGLSIGESTIESHLKKIPDALEARMK